MALAAPRAVSLALFLYDWAIVMGEKYARFLSEASHVAPRQHAAAPLMAQGVYLTHMINILWACIAKLMPLGKEEDVRPGRRFPNLIPYLVVDTK